MPDTESEKLKKLIASNQLALKQQGMDLDDLMIEFASFKTEMFSQLENLRAQIRETRKE